MSYAQTDQVGLARYPSPRLWKDCKCSQLNDLGLGFFLHADFNGGFETRVLAGPTVTLPDPTDAPATADALRDDLTAVWIPAVVAAFKSAGFVVTYTALTDAPSVAVLIADFNALLQEISDDFAAQGQQFGADLTAIPDTTATADAIRELIVTPTNAAIEAAFVNLFANQGYSMSNFEMDFDPNAILAATTGKVGGFLDVQVPAVDNDAFALFLRPFAEIRLNSGKKVWFEARIEIGAAADQGLFVGLAEEAALSRDVVADDCASLITESLIGFQILNTDTDGIDAVYRLDDGTVVEEVAIANNNAAITDAGGTIAAMAADTPRKVGMRFDGREKIEWFMDGVRVGSTLLIRSTFPDNVDLGFILGFKVGTAAARSFGVDWVRVAYQEQT